MAGSRTLVSWGHPTTGAVARCAPSNGVDPFLLVEGVLDLLGQGYAVVAADYPGLGVAGPSSYLIGAGEAHSVLDAARAARQVPEAGVGSDLLLWGHSQGGHAILFAAQEAPAYAPELHVRAAAVAAPAADLGALLDDDIGDVSGVTISAYAFAAYQAAYASRYPGLSLDSVLTAAGAAATPTMSSLCLLGQNAQLHDLAGPLVGGYLRTDPRTTAPWSIMLQENTPGARPVAVPLFVAQGLKDTLVHAPATQTWVSGACARGDRVVYREYPDADHGTIADAALRDVVAFFDAVEAGTPPASTC